MNDETYAEREVLMDRKLREDQEISQRRQHPRKEGLVGQVDQAVVMEAIRQEGPEVMTAAGQGWWDDMAASPAHRAQRPNPFGGELQRALRPQGQGEQALDARRVAYLGYTARLGAGSERGESCGTGLKDFQAGDCLHHAAEQVAAVKKKWINKIPQQAYDIINELDTDDFDCGNAQ